MSQEFKDIANKTLKKVEFGDFDEKGKDEEIGSPRWVEKPSEETYENIKGTWGREEISYDKLVNAINIYEFYDWFESRAVIDYDGYGELIIADGDEKTINTGIDALIFCELMEDTLKQAGVEDAQNLKFRSVYKLAYNLMFYKFEEYEINEKPGIFVAWYNK